MKKSRGIFIAFSAVAVIGILAIAIHCFVLFSAHSQILRNSADAAEYYSDYSIEKDEYLLETRITAHDGMDYISFTIRDHETGVVFDSLLTNGKWRISDFKEIKFAEDSLNVIVLSGDTGSTVYTYGGNGDWETEG